MALATEQPGNAVPTRQRSPLERIGRVLFKVPNETLRDEWVKKTLAAIPPGQKLLDAGCGSQQYRPFCSHLEYFGQDFGGYDGVGDAEGLAIEGYQYGNLAYRCDVWSIPERDATFDAVLCTEVLEHIPYPNETIKELVRLTKPGGTLVVTAPFFSIPHMTPYFFISGYHENWYRRIFEDNGCEVIEATAAGDAFANVLQEMMRLYKVVQPLPLRLLFGLFLVPVWCVLRLGMAAQFPGAKYLPFGYYVRARKRTNA
jgi:SAM-dependent methyltransferase